MEGSLHRLYKRAVTTELRNEDYTVYVEPADSPLAGLWWASYRPDVLGILSTTFLIKVTVAECETTPTRQRILTKASRLQQTLVLQPQLHERHAVRPLLIIPPMTLSRINYPAIRRFWEIWIVNRRGIVIHKIPRKTTPKRMTATDPKP
jgi:hypothetical protein